MPPEPAQVYSTYHRDGNWVWITCRARNSHGVLGNCWVVAGSALRWLTDNNEQRAGAVVQRRSSKLAGLCTSRRRSARNASITLTGRAFARRNPKTHQVEPRMPRTRLAMLQFPGLSESVAVLLSRDQSSPSVEPCAPSPRLGCQISLRSQRHTRSSAAVRCGYSLAFSTNTRLRSGVNTSLCGTRREMP